MQPKARCITVKCKRPKQISMCGLIVSHRVEMKKETEVVFLIRFYHYQSFNCSLVVVLGR